MLASSFHFPDAASPRQLLLRGVLAQWAGLARGDSVTILCPLARSDARGGWRPADSPEQSLRILCVSAPFDWLPAERALPSADLHEPSETALAWGLDIDAFCWGKDSSVRLLALSSMAAISAIRFHLSTPPVHISLGSLPPRKISEFFCIIHYVIRTS